MKNRKQAKNQVFQRFLKPYSNNGRQRARFELKSEASLKKNTPRVLHAGLVNRRNSKPKSIRGTLDFVLADIKPPVEHGYYLRVTA